MKQDTLNISNSINNAIVGNSDFLREVNSLEAGYKNALDTSLAPVGGYTLIKNALEERTNGPVAIEDIAEKIASRYSDDEHKGAATAKLSRLMDTLQGKYKLDNFAVKTIIEKSINSNRHWWENFIARDTKYDKNGNVTSLDDELKRMANLYNSKRDIIRANIDNFAANNEKIASIRNSMNAITNDLANAQRIALNTPDESINTIDRDFNISVANGLINRSRYLADNAINSFMPVAASLKSAADSHSKNPIFNQEYNQNSSSSAKLTPQQAMAMGYAARNDPNFDPNAVTQNIAKANNEVNQKEPDKQTDITKPSEQPKTDSWWDNFNNGVQHYIEHPEDNKYEKLHSNLPANLPSEQEIIKKATDSLVDPFSTHAQGVAPEQYKRWEQQAQEAKNRKIMKETQRVNDIFEQVENAKKAQKAINNLRNLPQITEDNNNNITLINNLLSGLLNQQE